MTTRPNDFDSWPPWAKRAQLKMENCGVEPAIILARALMLGVKIDAWTGPSRDRRDTVIKWIVKDPHGGLLGTTPELMAYRWLADRHPHALKTTP
jgi:hypothetical protein